MSNEELRSIVTDAVEAALEKQQFKHSCGLCRLDAAQHNNEHEALRRVIHFFDRMEEVRWGMVRKVVILIILAALAVFSLGFKETFINTLVGGP